MTAELCGLSAGLVWIHAGGAAGVSWVVRALASPFESLMGALQELFRGHVCDLRALWGRCWRNWCACGARRGDPPSRMFTRRVRRRRRRLRSQRPPWHRSRQPRRRRWLCLDAAGALHWSGRSPGGCKGVVRDVAPRAPGPPKGRVRCLFCALLGLQPCAPPPPMVAAALPPFARTLPCPSTGPRLTVVFLTAPSGFLLWALPWESFPKNGCTTCSSMFSLAGGGEKCDSHFFAFSAFFFAFSGQVP